MKAGRRERFLEEIAIAARLQAAAGVRMRMCQTKRCAITWEFIGNGRQGLSYVGASVLRGRLSGEQLEAAADLADKFGSGALRATVSQNLIFIDVPNEKAAELVRELGADRAAC